MSMKIYASQDWVNEQTATKITAPAVAEAGQTIVVKSVDETGKPIEWEAVDGTHYAEVTKEVLYDKEISFTSSTWKPFDTAPFKISKGNVLSVEFEGVEYICPVHYSRNPDGDNSLDLLWFGNNYIINLDQIRPRIDTGEPFFCYVSSGAMNFVVTSDYKQQTVSLKVAKRILSVKKKLDNEYLDLDWLPVTTSVYNETWFREISFDSNETGVENFGGDPFWNEYEDGDTMLVVINKDEYRCIAHRVTIDETTILWCGNPSLSPQLGEYAEDTGEPFLLVENIVGTAFDNAFYYTKKYFNQYITLSAYRQVLEDNKMPRHFLPDIVESINGNTGVVELSAADVGALPDSTVIPSIDHLATQQAVNDIANEVNMLSELVAMGSNWNQNDPSAPNYIANRTHYVAGITGTILPELQLEFNADLGMFALYQPVPIFGGEAYFVTVNGREYKGTALAQGNGVVLANDGANMNTGEGAEFGLMVFEEPVEGIYAGLMDFINPEATTATLSIRQEAVVHPLDPKFLPNGVPYYVEGGQFEIVPESTWTVDEDMGMMLLPSTLGLISSETYIVNWNGTEYTCVAADFMGQGVCLGDVYTASEGALGTESTGEPFFILDYSIEAMEGVFAVAIDFTGATTATVAIQHRKETEVRTLDEKLLPESIATKAYVDEMLGVIENGTY